METKPENPAAFPRSAAFGDGCHDWGQEGMTLRDYFAGQVIAGLAKFHTDTDKIAAEAYRHADAMLKARG